MRAVLVLLLLAGCSQGPSLMETMHRPGASQTEINADRYACERDARQTFPNPLWTQVPEIRAFARRCLLGRGWRDI